MLRTIITAVILATGLVSSVTANAMEKPFRFGVAPGLAAYEINDPNGSAYTATNFNPFNVIVTVDAGRDARVLIHGAHDSFSLTHTTNQIGQDVSTTSVDVSYQLEFRLLRGWKPWIGVGLGYNNESYTDRYTLTPGGFLGTTYPDRTKNDFLLIVNTSTQWRVSREWDMGVHLQWEQPTSSDGTRAVRLGLYFLY